MRKDLKKRSSLSALVQNENAKSSITLFLNTKNYLLLQETCENENKKIRSRNIRGEKLIKPSQVIDALIEKYLKGEI